MDFDGDGRSFEPALSKQAIETEGVLNAARRVGRQTRIATKLCTLRNALLSV